MLELEEAKIELVNVSPTIYEWEELPLFKALGRILAEDICAKADQPPFPRSPLDGYAVKGEETRDLSKDKPGRFQVIGKIYAGQVFSGIVESGQAVRIMTGAPIPAGANTVIRQEWTNYGEEEVEIYGKSKPFQDYCPQGEDYKKGQNLLKIGMKIDAITVSVLASLGYNSVKVYRQPKVAVISTGDEVIQPGEKMTAGKIYDSNRYFITARLLELGIEAFVSEHCADEATMMAERIKILSDSVDLIVTTGGVSVGEKDIMHHVRQVLGAEELFWRVDVKPGAPTLAFLYENTLVVCLSGNPFGAAVNFELLIRPILEKMTSNSRYAMVQTEALMLNDFQKKAGARRFLRGYYRDDTVCLPEGEHTSGTISSMLGCNCLVEIPKEQPGAKKGEKVCVHLL